MEGRAAALAGWACQAAAALSLSGLPLAAAAALGCAWARDYAAARGMGRGWAWPAAWLGFWGIWGAGPASGLALALAAPCLGIAGIYFWGKSASLRRMEEFERKQRLRLGEGGWALAARHWRAADLGGGGGWEPLGAMAQGQAGGGASSWSWPEGESWPDGREPMEALAMAGDYEAVMGLAVSGTKLGACAYGRSCEKACALRGEARGLAMEALALAAPAEAKEILGRLLEQACAAASRALGGQAGVREFEERVLMARFFWELGAPAPGEVSPGVLARVPWLEAAALDACAAGGRLGRARGKALRI